MYTILVGEISSYKSIVIAKFLKQAYPQMKIVGYDYKRFTKAFHTKYCENIFLIENPKKNKQNHIHFLSEIIRNYKIDLFIPVDSGMYGEYIKSKRLFGTAFLYVGEYAIYEQLHDKSKSQELAKNLSIRIPEIYKNISDAKIPFVVKPTNLSSSKGVKYIFSEKQRLKLKLNSQNEYVFQEYVQGVGCGFSVFAKNGEIQIGSGHIRLAELPVSGGSSVYRDNFNNQEMINIASKILRYTKWSGFAMFEFKLTPENEIVLIEVNPRIWGSINQGLQNGTNYFETLLGKTKVTYKQPVKTYLSPTLYLSLLKYLFRLQFKPIITFFSNLKKNHVDVNFFSDPKGYLSMLLRKVL